jgi:hypothetical protein
MALSGQTLRPRLSAFGPKQTKVYFRPGTVCPLLTHKRHRPAFYVAVAKGLCGVGCVAPHFNETRGEERARGLNVPIKIKEQI